MLKEYGIKEVEKEVTSKSNNMESIQNGDSVVSTKHPDLNNGLAFEVIEIEYGVAIAQINGDKHEFPLEDLRIVQKHKGGFTNP